MINRSTKKMMERVAVAVALGGVDYVVSKMNSNEAKKKTSTTNSKKKYYSNRSSYKRQAINK